LLAHAARGDRAFVRAAIDQIAPSLSAHEKAAVFTGIMASARHEKKRARPMSRARRKVVSVERARRIAATALGGKLGWRRRHAR
jgi:hypothetical protein